MDVRDIPVFPDTGPVVDAGAGPRFMVVRLGDGAGPLAATGAAVFLDEYSLAVANAWGLGRRGIDDGLLITIAYEERAMRIEVGYGLEPIISDQNAADVIRRMRPELAAGRSFAGIRTGSTEIIEMIRSKKDLVGTRKP